jgi:class 3 adenylate cyclase/tetratricopeptide (TPR) repeat protein
MLADLREELITARRIAVDEDDKVLVWTGQGSLESRVQGLESKTANLSDARRQTLDPRPVSYTPPHLAERIRAEQAALEARSGADGERKTITALFADLKGSTALIEGLDPEEARAIIDPALQLMMDAVHQYEGYVAQALGDGIFALFGAPIAHEDHPQRALYAALRMQEEMRRYADTLRAKGYPPLLMRVGINTGEVVLRSIRKDDLHTDYVPVGHSTNLAARMEQLATPGATVVSAYTHRLTDGYFAFKDLGKTQIKGVEDPLHVYEVLGAGPLRTRLQVAARRGLTRFVGRQSEMAQMQRTLDQAKAGHGQIVGVMGEPGLGKSRLFYEFKLLSLSGCLVLEAYSVSHGKASPYLPVIELLKSYFDIQAQDDERKRRERVIGKVLGLDRSLEDTLPYLFALLGIEEQPSPLQQMDAQIRRRRTFEALKKLFLRESLNQPLILIFEDLHWIDSETQGFLDVLSESVASAKLLLLTNYRPEYRHEWGQKTYYTQLRLAPFGKEEAEEFLDELLGEKGFPLPRGERDRERVPDNNLHALKQLILDKTEGTPFFMEEIVQELMEQGMLVRSSTVGAGHALSTEGAASSAPTAIHIPPNVQGVLAARIDRLAPGEKTLLQQLSIIGREFPLSLVRQVITQPEDELYHLLSSLQNKEFLYEQPAFPESEYIFKHALTQEVAYNSVLIERRKALHEQTAQAVEHLYQDRVEERYSELAHHYSRSNNTEKAIAYLQKAGEQAIQRSAHAEAIPYLTAALEVLKTFPDTAERAQQELPLQLSLARSLGFTKSFAAPELGAVYTRALALCEQVGETPQLFPALFGLRIMYFNRAELPTAREVAERVLSLAQQAHNAQFLPEARHGLGMILFASGEVVAARSHFEYVLALSDMEEQGMASAHYAVDMQALSRAILTNLLWILGYPDQALQRSREALTLTQRSDHPWNTALVTMFTLWLLHALREMPAMQQQAQALIRVAHEQGFSLLLAEAILARGWALAMQGHDEEGISQICEGMAILKSIGIELRRPHALALLAEAYGKAGQEEEGLWALAEALTLVDNTGERSHETELYRLKGELLLAQEIKSQKSKGKNQKSQNPDPKSQSPDPEAEAEACFLKAIDIARQQQAKSLELRAVMSLVRLRQQQATQPESRTTHHETRTRLAEAHTILSEIYNWFTEGFETKDLQEAKTLIEELNH